MVQLCPKIWSAPKCFTTPTCPPWYFQDPWVSPPTLIACGHVRKCLALPRCLQRDAQSNKGGGKTKDFRSGMLAMLQLYAILYSLMINDAVYCFSCGIIPRSSHWPARPYNARNQILNWQGWAWGQLLTWFSVCRFCNLYFGRSSWLMAPSWLSSLASACQMETLWPNCSWTFYVSLFWCVCISSIHLTHSHGWNE